MSRYHYYTYINIPVLAYRYAIKSDKTHTVTREQLTLLFIYKNNIILIYCYCHYINCDQLGVNV